MIAKLVRGELPALGAGTALSAEGRAHVERRLPTDYLGAWRGESVDVPHGYHDALGRLFGEALEQAADAADECALWITAQMASGRPGRWSLDRLAPLARAHARQLRDEGAIGAGLWARCAGPVTALEDVIAERIATSSNEGRR